MLIFSFVSLNTVNAQDFFKESLKSIEEVGNKSGLPISYSTDPRLDLLDRVITIIRYLFGFIGTILVVIIIYAGFRWMTAGGKEEQIKEAKSWIRNAVIGLLIIIMSYSIVYAVVTYITRSAGKVYN
jgi:amino acid transporter